MPLEVLLPSEEIAPFIVRFYQGAQDAHGRTLEQILMYDEHTLERRHDYIQYLFPLPERSPFNPEAPLIDRATFETFRSSEEIRERLRQSFQLMLFFYGFELETLPESGSKIIRKHKDWPRSFRNWVAPIDHNHLRITRIIRSLRVLGLENEALLFHQALSGVYEESSRISKRSMTYWTRAACRPLYLAPHDATDNGNAPDFLYEHEAAVGNDTQQNLNGNDNMVGIEEFYCNTRKYSSII